MLGDRDRSRSCSAWCAATRSCCPRACRGSRAGAAERARDPRAAAGAADVRSYLLTGNTRGGATAKLTHYGLIEFFPDGAFAEDTGERATIAARALELARRAGPVAEEGVFVIGDTPHDIECANAIGARTIAVATGGYSVEELAGAPAVALFNELPPPDEFMRLIDESRPRRDSAERRRIRMKHGIRRVPALWRATRLLRRWYHARFDAYPDWRAILAAEPALWQSARSRQGGPRVLMATAIGSYAHAITLESALAAALTFRGAEVHALLCDGAMTACAECEASLYPEYREVRRHGPRARSVPDCPWPAERVYRSLGLKIHRYSDWLTPRIAPRRGEIAATVPFDAIQGIHARRHGDRRARLRRRAAFLRKRVARRRAARRAGAAALSRVGAAHRDRHARA